MKQDAEDIPNMTGVYLIVLVFNKMKADKQIRHRVPNGFVSHYTKLKTNQEIILLIILVNICILE